MNRGKPAAKDVETEIEAEQPTPAEAPGQEAQPDDEERLKENREQLGVEEDHKTPDMKKGHRGTFP